MANSQISFGQYEKSHADTDITNSNDSTVAIMGLAGEVGDLLSAIKKKRRGDIATDQHKNAVKEEIGDCLWYIVKLCKVKKTTLNKALNKTKRMHIDELQNDTYNMSDFHLASKLIVEQGKLIDGHLKGDETEDKVREIVKLLSSVANSHGLTMGEVAIHNKTKTKEFFSTDFSSVKQLDTKYEDFEQIPRTLTVNIREVQVGQKKKTMLFIGNYIFGDPLEDNIIGKPDDYRFHDVFHLAFAANLGWSPNLRALLSRKRKSASTVVKNEDSGRPRVMEEGIVHLVFRYGRDNKYFKNAKKPRVESSLLKTISKMVDGFEVDKRPVALWNKAICDAFRIFLAVQEHRQGKISINLDKKTIKFKKIT